MSGVGSQPSRFALCVGGVQRGAASLTQAGSSLFALSLNVTRSHKRVLKSLEPIQPSYIQAQK